MKAMKTVKTVKVKETEKKKAAEKEVDDVGHVRHLNASNFGKTLKGELPVLVDFTASWCGPCKAIAPYIEQIAHERADTLVVGKVDIDESEKLADKYGVQGVPTLLVFVDGKVAGESVGSMPKKEILGFVDKAVQGKRPGMPKL